MSDIPVFEKKYAYSIDVLLYLHCEYSRITTRDVQDLLYLTQPHASNLLRHMWRRGWLERKIEFIKPRGRHYIYIMSKKGWLSTLAPRNMIH